MKVKATKSFKEEHEIEVEFPLYRKYTDNFGSERYYKGLADRFYEVTFKDQREFEINFSLTFSRYKNTEYDYITGTGRYSKITEEEFNEALQKAKDNITV